MTCNILCITEKYYVKSISMFQINVNHASKDIDEHIEAGYILNG